MSSCAGVPEDPLLSGYGSVSLVLEEASPPLFPEAKEMNSPVFGTGHADDLSRSEP